MIQQTSRDAYELLSLGDKQKAVMQMLIRQDQSVTNMELARLLSWEINCVTGRMKELRDMGKVVFVDKRPCKITGQTAMTWKANINYKKEQMEMF